MQIITDAKQGMALHDAMEIIATLYDKNGFGSQTAFRVGVNGNGNIVLETGGNVRLCDMGFTLSQVCPPM